MKVLVTGHRGFIGTNLVPILLNEGHDVVGLDTDLYRFCTYGDDPQSIPSIDKDVRDVEPDDLQGFEAIVHLAALSNDPLGNINPDLTYDINHKASVRIAEMGRAAKYLSNVMSRQWLQTVFRQYFYATQPLTVFHRGFVLT